MTTLETKMVECKCGNAFEADKLKTWCQKCARPVFYYEKDQRKHKVNSYYMYTIITTVIMFVSYLFVEMIAVPLLSM